MRKCVYVCERERERKTFNACLVAHPVYAAGNIYFEKHVKSLFLLENKKRGNERVSRPSSIGYVGYIYSFAPLHLRIACYLNSKTP